MTRLVQKYIAIIGAIYLLSIFIDSIDIGSLPALMFMGFILMIANMTIKPILLLVTLPFSILTLGLFYFVVNAWTIMIADLLVPHIHMGGFYNSLLTALIIVILQHLLKDKDKNTKPVK